MKQSNISVWLMSMLFLSACGGSGGGSGDAGSTDTDQTTPSTTTPSTTTPSTTTPSTTTPSTTTPSTTTPSTTTPASTDIPSIAGYELLWSDEFDASSLNASNWNIEYGYGSYGWGNDENQRYTGDAENLSIVDGQLKITAQCSDGQCGKRDGSVTSARITTKDKLEFKYGVVQAKIKVPEGQSTWPAFWLLGASFPEVSWPHVGEIDIMEIHQVHSDIQTTNFTTHWYDNGSNTGNGQPGHTYFSKGLKTSAPLSDAFHVYEMEWLPDRIIGKIDGTVYYTRMFDAQTLPVFQKEFFMILNVAVDGTLGGEPNQIKHTPQSMLIDWVRVYQKPDYDESVDTGDTLPGDNNGDGIVYLYASTAGTDLLADTDFKFQEWGSGSQLQGDYSGDASYSPVFKVTSGSGWGGPTAALAMTGMQSGFAQSYDTLQFKVKGLPVDSVWVKLASGGGVEHEHELALSSYGTAIAEASGWYQVSVPLSIFPSLADYTEFAIHSGWGNGGTMLLTDIGLTKS